MSKVPKPYTTQIRPSVTVDTAITLEALSKDNPLGCNYEDDAGVKDAAKEVRNLKKNGIRVGAILFGSHDASKEARIIYENEYVRMKSVDQLANAAGFLIRKEVASINV